MNRAGKSTRRMAQKRRRTTNYILIGVLILGIILTLTILNGKALGLSGGVVLFLLLLLKALPDLIDKRVGKRIKEERRATRGAVAEEIVGELLNLGVGYYVLHDIPSSHGNIDHVVIGKTSGVFLIETKAHGGRVEFSPDNLLINGKLPEKDIIGQALRNTFWLRDELEKILGNKIWITPVVVFTNAFVPAGKPIKGVYVVNKKYLLRTLSRQTLPTSILDRLWQEKDQIAKILIKET